MTRVVAGIQNCMCLIAWHLAGLGRSCRKQAGGVLVVGGFWREEIGWGKRYEEDHDWEVGSVAGQNLEIDRQVGFGNLKLDKGPVGSPMNYFRLVEENLIFVQIFH